MPENAPKVRQCRKINLRKVFRCAHSFNHVISPVQNTLSTLDECLIKKPLVIEERIYVSITDLIETRWDGKGKTKLYGTTFKNAGKEDGFNER